MPFRPAASAPSRRVMEVAFEELSRTIAQQDSRDFHSQTLEDVWKASLDLETQLAAKQSLCHMRRLMPLFQALEHYSKTMDILCNGTPYLPWIWAPITLILRIASEYVEAFDQIIKGYARIASSLKRFDLLGNAFSHDPEFQQTLAIFYADILQFHKHAYKFVRRSGWKLLFLTSWGRFERRFNGILDDMKQHEALIDNEASARGIAATQQLRQEILSWREDNAKKVAAWEKEQSARQYQSILSWLRVDDSDQLAILESISAEGAKYDGTCSWMLGNAKIKSWLQRKPDTPMLWLQGNPGTGKSTMATQLIAFMKNGKLPVIHHFCTYAYASSTNYEQILRSLLLQLLQNDGDLVAHVYGEHVLAKKSPTTVALEQLLQAILSSMSSELGHSEYVWVVIDGLDECEAGKQSRLLSLMNHVLASKSSTRGGAVCKVLLSSRPSQTLSKRLRKRPIVSLTEEKSLLYQAITQYASLRLRSLHLRFAQLNIGADAFGEIASCIAKKADGMFLYARLVIDYLSSNIFYNAEEIRASINQLPDKLADFYWQILTRLLAHLDVRSEQRIRCILGWVAFAKRPLKRLEFLSAVTFSAGDPDVTQLVPAYVLDICAPILEERADTTVAFIHVSLKDFLQSSASNIIITEKEAIQEHGTATISCLLSGLNTFRHANLGEAGRLQVAKGVHSFQIYATEHWTEYLLSMAEATNGIDLTTSTFRLASELAEQLEQVAPAPMAADGDAVSDPIDDRLRFLGQHTLLYRQVENALKGRSLRRLEDSLLNTRRTPFQPSFATDAASVTLASYQACVGWLLEEHVFPGLSAEDLETFKSEARTTIFTCRLHACPRATTGFDSENSRLEHERSHLRWFPCVSPGCHYPPFASASSLRNHVSKYHSSSPVRKTIRRVRAIPTEPRKLKRTGDHFHSPTARRAENERYSLPLPHPSQQDFALFDQDQACPPILGQVSGVDYADKIAWATRREIPRSPYDLYRDSPRSFDTYPSRGNTLPRLSNLMSLLNEDWRAPQKLVQVGESQSFTPTNVNLANPYSDTSAPPAPADSYEQRDPYRIIFPPPLQEIDNAPQDKMRGSDLSWSRGFDRGQMSMGERVRAIFLKANDDSGRTT